MFAKKYIADIIAVTNNNIAIANKEQAINIIAVALIICAMFLIV